MPVAAVDLWSYQPHPEVWLLMVGAVALAWYVVNVVAPNAVPEGQTVVTRRNTVAYATALVALWVASDWPLHDIAEDYLYSGHMIQHLIISFVVPPLLLTAVPEWLARLIMSPTGQAGSWIKRFSSPVFAGVTFNLVIAAGHLPAVVNKSVEVEPLHYGVHTVVFVAALMMWIPVIGPIKELRMGLPGQMIYLFLMSVVPTVPAGFLTFADGVLYEVYDHGNRLWGIDVTTDQQIAGLIMKLVGGMYLWGWIIVRFFQWNAQSGADQYLIPVELTYEDVQVEFDHTDPAPVDQP